MESVSLSLTGKGSKLKDGGMSFTSFRNENKKHIIIVSPN
jgi:hypothetical protein